MTDAVQTRLELARRIAEEGAAIAMGFFRDRERLTIERKGLQDVVSEADRAVETALRRSITAAFPEDGIIGEEEGRSEGASDFTWVLDPVDGTANFVAGIPTWCTIIAVVHQGETVVGAISDPNNSETFWAVRGGGAFLNDAPMRVSPSTSIQDGNVGVGYASRIPPEKLMGVLGPLIDGGGMFYRNASGGLMLAYTAAGRLIGYHEAHLNPWDGLAGLLMVEEAGGRVWPYAGEPMLSHGAPVLAAAPGVFDALDAIAAPVV